MELQLIGMTTDEAVVTCPASREHIAVAHQPREAQAAAATATVSVPRRYAGKPAKPRKGVFA